MLEKLTQKQIDLQKVVRDEWIDIALHKKNFDKEELEVGIKWLYYSSNLKEPKVVFVKSPMDFAKKLLPKKSASVWASVRASVRDSVRASVRDSVWASVGASVWASVWASVGDSVRASVSWTSLVYDADWGAYYDYWTRIEAITPQEKADK